MNSSALWVGKTLFSIAFNYTNFREHGRNGIEAAIPKLITPDEFIIKKLTVMGEDEMGEFICEDEDGKQFGVRANGQYVSPLGGAEPKEIRLLIQAACGALRNEHIELLKTHETAPDYSEKEIRADWLMSLIIKIQATLADQYPGYDLVIKYVKKEDPSIPFYDMFYVVKTFEFEETEDLSGLQLFKVFEETRNLKIVVPDTSSVSDEAELTMTQSLRENGTMGYSIRYSVLQENMRWMEVLAEHYALDDSIGAFKNLEYRLSRKQAETV